jgi:hypothetical protein
MFYSKYVRGNCSLGKEVREMKKILALIVTFSLLLISFAVYADSEQQASQPPPVAPPLVREGDFSMKLVGALNLGTAKDETEAESMLIAVGIAPRNGWISDYPVTPDIVAEIQKAVGEAGDANRLPMAKSDGLGAVQSVEASFGLAVVPDTSGRYAEAQPPATPQYTEPSVVDNYYDDQGPPVVTYYPPPWDYYYLYAWVPFPFWYTGFFFPGFFVLNDFDRVVFVHGNRCFISNHFFDRDHHRFSRVDPGRRWGGGRESMRAGDWRSEGRGFRTADARRGAESILQRSREGRMASRGSTGRTFSTSSGRNSRSFNGRNGGRAQMAPNQNFRGVPGGSERSFSTPNRNGARSFSPPAMRSGGRSFNPPMGSAGRSFSPPSMSGRGFSGGSHLFSGGFSGSFRGGGFGHGGSFGEFHGGGSGGLSHGGGFTGR